MKITPRNVAHAWAHALKPKGRGGNVSFQGDDIYSYSTIMATIAWRAKDPNAPSVVLVNVSRYSVTTSGHQSQIRGAIPSHWIRIDYAGRGYGYGFGSGDPGDPVTLILGQWDERRKALKDMRHNTRAEAVADLDYLSTLQAAAKIMGGKRLARVRRFDLAAFNAAALPWAANAERWDRAEAIAAKRSEAAQRAANTRRAANRERWAKVNAEHMERRAAQLAAWLAGDNNAYPAGHAGPVRLRIMDDEVQTSNGAAIPLGAARMIFAAWKAGKLLPGQHAGAYTVHTVADDHFVAGCTRIDRDTAEAFAEAQGWR